VIANINNASADIPKKKNEDTMNNQQTEAKQTVTQYSSMIVGLPVQDVESDDDDM
jgi:hypothetical protein